MSASSSEIEECACDTETLGSGQHPPCLCGTDTCSLRSELYPPCLCDTCPSSIGESRSCICDIATSGSLASSEHHPPCLCSAQRPGSSYYTISNGSMDGQASMTSCAIEMETDPSLDECEDNQQETAKEPIYENCGEGEADKSCCGGGERICSSLMCCQFWCTFSLWFAFAWILFGILIYSGVSTTLTLVVVPIMVVTTFLTVISNMGRVFRLGRRR